MSTRPDITAIVIGRDEGLMVGVSLRSVLDATETARRAGLTVELLVVLADATPATRTGLGGAALQGARVEQLADRGRSTVRRQAIELATGEYIAMIDDASLWSENWLVAAHAVCSRAPGSVIAHPEAYWFFDQGRELFFLADQDHAAFDPAYLRIANHWDALCLAPAEAYEAVPLGDPEGPDELVDDDWTWSIDTVAAGLVHRVAPDTLHFKRSRPASLFLGHAGTATSQPRTRSFPDGGATGER